MDTILDAKLARELLFIDESGALRWRVARGMKKAGSLAGSLKADGYIDICIAKKTYGAARVVWLLTHGEWPKLLIDHINRDKSDNRIENLREANYAQSSANRDMPLGTLNLKGVTPHPCGKYQAQIKHRGKGYYLGLFPTSEEAAEAYRAANQRLHGEFGVRV